MLLLLAADQVTQAACVCLYCDLEVMSLSLGLCARGSYVYILCNMCCEPSGRCVHFVCPCVVVLKHKLAYLP